MGKKRKKKKKKRKRTKVRYASPEQIQKIAGVYFGGKYYCIGDKERDSV